MLRSATLLLFVAIALAAATDYHGHQVFRITPTTPRQLSFLLSLKAEDQELEFHSEPRLVDYPVVVMVPPSRVDRIAALFAKSNLSYETIVSDVHSTIEAERLRLAERFRNDRAFNINDFNTFDDIISQLDLWARYCPNGLSCSLRDLTTTAEGRQLVVLKLSTGGSGKQVIWMDATTHSREWLSTATILKITDHLLVNYNTDPEVTQLLDNYDFHILPVVNPDGYEYSWTNDRMWRKNRKFNGVCYGTDLNRNYDYEWAEEGVSSNPCADTYPGPGPASEVETQAVSQEAVLLQQTQGVKLYITIHTFGRMILFPWGSTVNNNGFQCNLSDDYDDMRAVADAFGDAAERTDFTSWRRGTVCQVIYAATGGSDSWAKGGAGIKYSYTPELRGSWFIVNNSEIQPSFVQTWAGIVAMLDEIDRRS